MSKAIPFRAKLVHEANSKAATIEVLDDIRPFMGVGVFEINQQLKAAGDVDEITLLIHSRGGSAVEGFAMYTLLAMHKAVVNVEVLGLAASAASTVAMAGDKIRISETGHLMIHDPHLFAQGNAERLRYLATQLDAIKPSILAAYMRHAAAKGTTESQLLAWMGEGGGAGHYFSAQEAVDAGLAHEVYKAPAITNQIDLDELPDNLVQLWGDVGKKSASADQDDASIVDRVLSAFNPSKSDGDEVLGEVLSHFETPETAPADDPRLHTLVDSLFKTA